MWQRFPVFLCTHAINVLWVAVTLPKPITSRQIEKSPCGFRVAITVFLLRCVLWLSCLFKNPLSAFSCGIWGGRLVRDCDSYTSFNGSFALWSLLQNHSLSPRYENKLSVCLRVNTCRTAGPGVTVPAYNPSTPQAVPGGCGFKDTSGYTVKRIYVREKQCNAGGRALSTCL